MRYRRPSRFRRIAKWEFLVDCVILFCFWIVSTLPWSWIPVMLLIALAIPTAIFWYRDRRPRKGHCLHCGYNLTGNESGVCPECAAAVPNGVIAK